MRRVIVSLLTDYNVYTFFFFLTFDNDKFPANKIITIHYVLQLQNSTHLILMPIEVIYINYYLKNNMHVAF